MIEDRVLLAMLAVSPTESCRRDTLTTVLWADVDADKARASLRQGLVTLRKSLGSAAAALWTDDEAVGLRAGAWRVDVDELVSASVGRSHPVATPLTGVFLRGVRCTEPAIEAWLDAKWHRVDELCLAALDRSLEAAVHDGDLPTAIQLGLRSLVIDPLRESFHRQLMRIHDVQGDSTRALRRFRDLRDRLHLELNVPPEAQNIELFERIRRARRLSPIHARRASTLKEQERELARAKRWTTREHERVVAMLQAGGDRTRAVA